MGPPILWLASNLSNDHTGERYIARLWNEALPPDEAAAGARSASVEKPAIM
jgi:3-oxoacyl-[acyl-carrier protein] reductase